MTEERLNVGVKHPNRCPFCHDEVRPDQEKTACEGCMAWHHRECWETHGGACSACGRGVRETAAPSGSVQADLAGRAERFNRALDAAQQEREAPTPTNPCVVQGCQNPRFGMGRYCAGHRVKDGKVLALVGALNLAWWSVLGVALGGSGGQDVIGISCLLGGLGAAMMVYGISIVRAARAQVIEP